MTITSTPKKSTISLCCSLLLALFMLSSCSTRVEREVEQQPEAVAVAVETPTVTVAAIENAADKAYFDLVAQTSTCLGENLWLGGKLESNPKIALASSGAIVEAKDYRITELTATGLKSNKSYMVRNDANTLKAITGSRGEVYIQLSEGQLQLLPKENARPLVLAYQPVPAEGFYDGTPGRWSCE